MDTSEALVEINDEKEIILIHKKFISDRLKTFDIDNPTCMYDLCDEKEGIKLYKLNINDIGNIPVMVCEDCKNYINKNYITGMKRINNYFIEEFNKEQFLNAMEDVVNSRRNIRRISYGEIPISIPPSIDTDTTL